MVRNIVAPAVYTIAVGDRIVIHQSRQALAALVGHAGTVVEVFRAPLGSCLMRFDEGNKR